MAEKVKIDVAVVGAQQAAAQTKTLKQQIKDLRTELEGLTAGTEEYNQKITELGNAMHQQQEITEQARMATQDYGATLGNLSSIASGVVGSITAVNGVMNVLGASNKGAEETIKTMTSLMGIMQGLKSLEDAEKNFQKLWQKIKLTTSEVKGNTTAMKGNSVAAKEDAVSMGQATTATKAQGVAAATTTKATNLLSVGFRKLGLAIKAFMMSNPFTLILLAITTIYSIISNIIDKQREATAEMERQKREIRDINLEYGRSQNGSTGYTPSELETLGRRETDSYISKYGYQNKALNPYEDNNKENFDNLYTNWKTTLQNMENAGNKFTENYKKKYEDFLISIKGMQVQYINWLNSEITRMEGLSEDSFSGSKSERRRQYAEAIKDLEKYREEVSKYYQNMGEEWIAWNNYIRDFNKDEKDREKAQQQKDAANWKQLQADELSKLKDKYDLQRKLAENEYKRDEKSGEEYYKRLREIENEYYEEYQKWAKKFRVSQQDRQIAEANHKAAILAINKSLNDELRKLMEERMRILQNSKDPTNDIERQDAEKGQERALELAQRTRDDNERVMMAEEETRRQRLDFDAGWFYTKLRMLEQYNRDAARLEHEGEIERMRIQEERQENDRLFIQSEYDRNRDNINRQKDYEMEMLRKKFDEELALQRQYAEDNELGKEYIQKKRLELEQEYGDKYVELDHEYKLKLMELETDYINDIAQAEADLADTRLNIQREEFAMEQELFEQKKEMIKSYISAFSSITSAVSSLLSEVQNQYKEGTKQYEQIAEAMLIMQTIEGSLAAFVSGVESGLPAPWNFALGAVLAGLATATGVMAIQNLKSKKLSSSAANAPNVNPYETLSYETNSNIEGNIQDSRCYVLEEDITSTQNRVSVAETEASF